MPDSHPLSQASRCLDSDQALAFDAHFRPLGAVEGIRTRRGKRLLLPTRVASSNRPLLAAPRAQITDKTAKHAVWLAPVCPAHW